jgi:hypothetical protein
MKEFNYYLKVIVLKLSLAQLISVVD